MENGRNDNGFAENPAGARAEGVQRVLRQVQNELRDLLEKRAEVTHRIGAVKRTIVGLASVFGDQTLTDELRELVDGGSVERKPGLTKACRRVLMEASQAMSVREVHDQLHTRDPDLLAAHKDPMASVTTVLNRLADYGEAQRVVLGNGRRAWQWAAGSAPSRDLNDPPHSSSEPPAGKATLREGAGEKTKHSGDNR